MFKYHNLYFLLSHCYSEFKAKTPLGLVRKNKSYSLRTTHVTVTFILFTKQHNVTSVTYERVI